MSLFFGPPDRDRPADRDLPYQFPRALRGSRPPPLTAPRPGPPLGARIGGRGPMRIGIVGCAGRMGRANLREVLETAGADLAGGVERPGHPALGQDLGVLAGLDPVGIPATDDLDALLAASDAVIEF